MNQVTFSGDQPYLVVDSPFELARWRPLVNWLLYIPHGIWTYVTMVENDYPKFALPSA